MGDRPVRFRGAPVAAAPGTPLARTLLGRGERVLGRSLRYHRPRAPYCGTGACTNCLVRVNGVPNVRSCRYVPWPGDSVETLNGWPSARFDLLGAFDLLFPRGLDTLRSFRRPAFATPLYHRVVRRLAGFGPLAEAVAAPPIVAGERRETDLLVVGGGVAARALVAAAAPTTPPLVVERGGPVDPIPGAEVLDRTTALFLPPPADGDFELLAYREDGPARRIRARRVVVAVGGYDAGLWFAGSDRPGVMTAEGAESLLAPRGAGPRRAVVFGGGERVGSLLERFGERVEAIVAPGSVGPEVAERASALGIPIYPRTLLVEAVGRAGVRAVRLRPRGGGRPFTVGADAIWLAHRRLPNPQLFFQAGARMEWRGLPGAYYPVLSGGSATSVPGLFAIGEAAGFTGTAASESGKRLGDRFAGATGTGPEVPRSAVEGVPELYGYYQELLPRLPHWRKTVACPCEDVLLRELEESHARGYRGIEVTKRYTGLGTGLCQGRYCLPEAILLLSAWEGRPPPEVGYITQRPPVMPAPLGALAGLPDREPTT